jgi:hypothetical protein
MEYYNNMMCVTYGELSSGEGSSPVIKECTLRQNIARGNIDRAVRGGGEGSRALIVWASIPEKYKARWIAKYGHTPEELYKQSMMKEFVKADRDAAAFYEAYRYELNGVQTSLSDELKERYTNNASVLRYLVGEAKDKASQRKRLNNSNGGMWAIVQHSCEQLRYRTEADRQEDTPFHTLPRNLSRLKAKMREFDMAVTAADGTPYPYNYYCLVSGKLGNNNTLKITGDVAGLLLALKRCHTPVFTDRQILERFNEVEVPKHNAAAIARGEEWKPLRSLKALVGWFNQPEIQPYWYDAVHGELAARQRFSIQLKTELASCRDARWEGDGTKLNLYYRDAFGNRATAYVYEVIDTYSEALLGYWIDTREYYLPQYHAFRMAVQNTRRKPFEIVTDNQGGAKTRKMQGFMNAISRVARPTKANNPQSKTIESVLGRFQQQVLHQQWAFTGQNVTAKKPGSKPNLEFVLANAAELPTLPELKAQYAAFREMWNGERPMLTTGKLLTHPTSGMPRMEMYRRSVNGQAPEITEREMAESFWLWTDRPREYGQAGIEIEIDRMKYRYEVFAADEVNRIDAEWLRRNMYRKFWVKYDPYDMSQVKLYWEDKAGNRRFERIASPPVVTVHRAIQDQKEGEQAYIRSVLETNRQGQLHRHLAAKEIEYAHGVAPEQNGLHTPKLNGFSGESMAEANLMFERRVRKYRTKSIAQENKDISMMTYGEVQEGDKGEQAAFSFKRAVDKL